MIKVVAKIGGVSSNCERCGEAFYLPQKSKDHAKCYNCGAFYEVEKLEVIGSEVNYEYQFSNFRCVFKSFNVECSNICPTADMFCKEHCSDSYIKSSQELAKSLEERVLAQGKLIDKLEESKRSWLIEELSGVSSEYTEDDSIPKN